VLESERKAREIAELRSFRRRRHSHDKALKPHVTLDNLSEYLNQDDKPKEMRIVLKADVQGSVEAVGQALEKLGTEKVIIKILHGSVGPVNESNIQLAQASDALMVGFHVPIDPAARDLSQSEGIQVLSYDVIYHLTNDIQKAMLGMLDKKFKEVPQGKAEIRQIFKVTRLGNIAGCYVTDGVIRRNDKIRIRREGKIILEEGSLASLRRVKDDVTSVQTNFEFGMTVANFQDIREGDICESYIFEEVEQTL